MLDDQRVLAILRDLADVVLVGAGTIRAEGYGGIRLTADRLERRRRWGLGGQPPLAVMTARGFDSDAAIFTDTPVPPLVFTTAAGAERMKDVAATVIVAGDESVDLDVMLADLGDRGLNRILCEGGPGLLGRLVAADRLDELCLTGSPDSVGRQAVDPVVRSRVGGPDPLEIGERVTQRELSVHAASPRAGGWVAPSGPGHCSEQKGGARLGSPQRILYRREYCDLFVICDQRKMASRSGRLSVGMSSVLYMGGTGFVDIDQAKELVRPAMNAVRELTDGAFWKIGADDTT